MRNALKNSLNTRQINDTSVKNFLDSALITGKSPQFFFPPGTKSPILT
jgi:hypothetical protein